MYIYINSLWLYRYTIIMTLISYMLTRNANEIRILMESIVQ